jgi:Leucine-rich repeat (LRR) protein
LFIGSPSTGTVLEVRVTSSAPFRRLDEVWENAMTRFLALSCVVSILTLIHSASSAHAVAIPDKNLEAALRSVLRDVKGEFTDQNLANVYVLEADGKSISNLSGLEKCKNLAQLKLSHNQIVDLTPLKDLANLQSLDLANNKITDVTPLKGLVALQYLELSHNEIAKIEPLAGLTKLSALYLSHNKVTDIGPVGSLTNLASLYLDHNQVHDLSPLAKVTKLNCLDLKDNAIKDLAPLAKQTELRILCLERNQVADLASLVAACKADAEGEKRFAPYLQLYLTGNPLSDSAKSQQVAALKGYGVRVDPQQK